MSDQPPRLLSVEGTIVSGYGSASGRNPNCPYPGGTLKWQFPLFAKLGLDLSDCFPGTLNLALNTRAVKLVGADHTYQNLRWTERIPPEDFSFSRAKLEHPGGISQVWIYYPHPETKVEHDQPPNLLELLAPWIPNLPTGTPVTLHAQADHLSISPS